jgi:small subunit ribosomal protein S16
MAVSIRLSRAGRVHLPFYRIGVYDSRTRRDGRPIEQLGFYDPESKKEKFRLDLERAKHWLSVGARPSATVRTLLRERGLAAKDWTPSPVKATPPKKRATFKTLVERAKTRKVKKRAAARTANSQARGEKARKASAAG